MKRREFITLLGAGAAVAWPLQARAQQGERVRRIGVLMNLAAHDPELQRRMTGFVQALQALGWTDGRNVKIDYRWGAGDVELYRRYAAELLALMPDVILVSGTPVMEVLRGTHTHGADRVRAGRRPGQRRVRRKPSASGRECHWVYWVGVRLQREMARTAKGNCSIGEARGSSAGSH